MYFGKSDPIPLPTVGHLHILKNGYVYWERTSSWDKKKEDPSGKDENPNPEKPGTDKPEMKNQSHPILKKKTRQIQRRIPKSRRTRSLNSQKRIKRSRKILTCLNRKQP